MAKKKYKTKEKEKSLAEPITAYKKTNNKTIHIFSSFEEENEYVAKERAAQSYDKRMQNAETLRKLVFNKYLQPDGSWKPVERIFKIMKPYVNEIN